MSKKVMKKILSIILIASSINLFGSTTVFAAESGKNTQDAVSAVIKKYSGEKGVESMNLGKVGLGAFRALIRLSSDKDARAMLELTKGIKGMSMLEYDDCSAMVRKQINAEIETALAGKGMLMELHDDGDSVKIYGTVAADGASVSDTVIFIPDDCTLICFYGSVCIDALQNAVDL